MPKQNASRGRPRLLDPIKKAEICALAYAGCSQRHAAIYVGVAPSTISAEMNRDPDFDRAYLGALRKREHDRLADIHAGSDESWRAAAWHLEKAIVGNCLHQPEQQSRLPPPNHTPRYRRRNTVLPPRYRGATTNYHPTPYFMNAPRSKNWRNSNLGQDIESAHTPCVVRIFHRKPPL